MSCKAGQSWLSRRCCGSPNVDVLRTVGKHRNKFYGLWSSRARESVGPALPGGEGAALRRLTT